MKVKLLQLFFTVLVLILTPIKTWSVQFDVLVLPTNLFEVCDNYFCFPEASEIVAQDVVNNLNSYKNIQANNIAYIRSVLNKNTELKNKTKSMLDNYKNFNKVDFETLKILSDTFGGKSTLLISSYSTTDKSTIKRDLWDILELSSAFKFTYPFELKINTVLTDNINGIIMWSGHYTKNVSDSNGHFSASNQAQAISQFEKIKDYSKNNVSQNISQNVHLRFFPHEVRTINIPQIKSEQETKFMPNALEKLSQPRMLKEIEDRDRHFDYTREDIFSF
ncbi:hypothetical protein IJ579_06375 [bacterium]|nr:hypothetical protein [bacterium]